MYRLRAAVTLLFFFCVCLTQAQDDFCPESSDACRQRPDGPVCSGRGQCVCGVCECHRRADPSEQVSGRFCECNNFSCDRFIGLLCGGPDRGVCECGLCRCRPGWQGQACECSTSQRGCQAAEDQPVCSGRGVCQCGRCRCEPPNAGEFCQECPTCPGRCETLRECVECRYFHSGECSDRCPADVEVTVDDDIQPLADAPGHRLCAFYSRDRDCRFRFVYSQARPTSVVVQRDATCAPGTKGSEPQGSGSGHGPGSGLILQVGGALILVVISAVQFFFAAEGGLD